MRLFRKRDEFVVKKDRFYVQLVCKGSCIQVECERLCGVCEEVYSACEGFVVEYK